MGVFRTTEGRGAVRARYNEILSQFPLEKRYVDTPQGRTFVLEAGPKAAPAVVLLHGSCVSSAFWLSDIFPLAARFRVLAPDIPGEAGLSDENRFDFRTDACVSWLDNVLDALSVTRAALIGNALGGWMALKYAVSRPERVAKLVPVVPAGIVPPSALFEAEALKAKVEAGEGREEISDAITSGAALPEPVAEFLRLIGEHFLPMTEALPVFPNEALRALSMPALFAFAERDATMDAFAAAKRVRTLLPRAEARLLKEQGHMLMNIAEIALPFLLAPQELTLAQRDGVNVALIDRWARVTNPQDLLDAMANAGYLGAGALAAYAESLGEEFFDLKTGVAGEMLQKFSNYRMRFAIIGDFSNVQSRSLRDFIRESNGGSTVCFVGSLDDALSRLARGEGGRSPLFGKIP
jgi:pimeloyl-ACP methyl ester carboxylesterase